ncbi:hypothetical protein HYDPIDRAFT_144970 [Hydnomerulius pinastri MD-312]|nr:hypothetical protein HYDPIDRAFT_144970 [Hydnomerulius pinastri MD-312]
MLAVATGNGTCLVDPASLKNPSNSFPTSSSLECTANAWSSDNSQLYLAHSTYIKRYTPSEGLLEEVYSGSDPVTSLIAKGKGSTIFFAAANGVRSLDCTPSPGKVLSTLEPHKSSISALSISNDSTLLASMSESAVFVHNLTLSSHVSLRGLPAGKAVTCCMFHLHSRTRLLVGVGRDVLVYDTTRPSGPLKTVHIPGGSAGHVVALTASPFSKTLLAVATSNGDVTLVDLDKDKGILKTVDVKTALTSCAFTAEGAAIYLGTRSGTLLILDLRALEKEPKSVVIGDGDSPIQAINVQKKSKINTSDTKVKPSRDTTKKASGPSPELVEPRVLTRTTSVTSSPTRARSKAGSIGAGVRSPAHVPVASKLRGGGGGGVTPKKKLFSPSRSPLTENRNFGLNAQPANSRSSVDQVTATQRENPSSSSPSKPGRSTKGRLGVRAEPHESISGHLAAMRTRSGSKLDFGTKQTGGISPNGRRVVSESHNGSSSRRGFATSASSSAVGTKEPSSKRTSHVAQGPESTQQVHQRSITPENDDDRTDLSSPDLPRDPVTPISLGKKKSKTGVSTGSIGMGVPGLGSPEVAKWARGGDPKGKGKEVEVKKARFLRPEGDAESDGETDDGEATSDFEAVNEDPNEERDKARDKELSMQVSPRRPTAPPTWLPSPHRPSQANLNMNATAQDFLRNIVRDVMYDFQRETKAEMMGLHLDLVRMGRGWRRELREVMEEWGGEAEQLREENKRLREENERLRRGY